MNLGEELKGLGGKKKIKLLYSCGVVLFLICAIVMVISGLALIVAGVMVAQGVLFLLLSVPLCLFEILAWNVSCALYYDVRLIREKMVNSEEITVQIGAGNQM